MYPAYEKYLLEFVYASPFFLKKSKGQVYTAPESEHENYVAFVFENNLFVLQFNKSSVDVTDIIPVTKSKIFCQLRSVAKAF